LQKKFKEDNMENQSAETLKQAITFKKEKIVKGITCPSCGGELDLREGMKSFNCKYCGTLLVVKGDEGTLKYFVPKKLKREDAISRAMNWLGEGMSKAKGLRQNSRIDEAFLIYIPFWRVKADVVGWVFGQKEESSGNSTTYVDKEIKIQNTFDTTLPACDISELGVKKVNLTGDEILPIDFEKVQTDGMVFNVIASEKEIEDTVLVNFINEARNEVKLDRINFENYNLVRKHISIVYFPLWVVRYVFNNRTYQVLIDAANGEVSYGKAPGSNLFRAIMGIIGTAAGMFLATFFEIFLLSKNPGKFHFAVYAFCLIAGIALMRSAYKKFRYGGEIVEGTGVAEEKAAKLVDTKGFFGAQLGGLSNGNNVMRAVGTLAAGSILSSFLNSDDN